MAYDGAIYNDPAGGNPSTVGSQIRTDYFEKKALVEVQKEQYFTQMADVTSMPKNMGKKIKRYHYIPLLDDANINDQGIDAAGNLSSPLYEVSIGVTTADGSIPIGSPFFNGTYIGNVRYITGTGTTAAAAEDAAVAAFNSWAQAATAGGGLGLSPTPGTADAEFAEVVTTGGASAYDLGYRFVQPDGTVITAAAGALEAQAVFDAGNMYGSSKDVGTISAKLPALSETGGRVNRVGYKRIELEGTFAKFGFFDEYTQESLDFDSDAELEMHIHREAVFAANEITEDALQIDLLNAAGVIRYAGGATSTATLSGDNGGVTEVTYGDLMRLSIDLDNNRCPKNTKIITGSRMVDTKTIDAARYMYVGSELLITLKEMVDSFSNKAFIPVQQYAAAGQVARGEVGSIDQFRIIVVPEMMHWAGAGAAVGTNDGYRETGGNYDVFPMLVVGDGSFTTIGFQTDGKTVKFKITHKKPGPETADSYNDPYGEVGFFSIKWYYGFMALRPERIALIKTVAKW